MDDNDITMQVLDLRPPEPEPRLCDNCQKRLGTIKWVGNGGAMDLIHGFYDMWCTRCAARAQLKHALGRAKAIPGLVWKSFV